MYCIQLFFIVIHNISSVVETAAILARQQVIMSGPSLLTELSTGLSKPRGINHLNRFQRLCKSLQ